MTITKAMLAEVLFNEVGLNKREAKEFVESFFEEIVSSLINGRGVKLSGYGNFILRDKSHRMGRNPKTGAAAEVAERRVVIFRPGQKLKDRVKDYVCRVPEE